MLFAGFLFPGGQGRGPFVEGAEGGGPSTSDSFDGFLRALQIQRTGSFCFAVLCQLGAVALGAGVRRHRRAEGRSQLSSGPDLGRSPASDADGFRSRSLGPGATCLQGCSYCGRPTISGFSTSVFARHALCLCSTAARLTTCLCSRGSAVRGGS